MYLYRDSASKTKPKVVNIWPKIREQLRKQQAEEAARRRRDATSGQFTPGYIRNEINRRAGERPCQPAVPPERKRIVKMATIEKRILKVSGLTRDDLRSTSRDQKLYLARWAIYYWSYRLTDMTMKEIGDRMGVNHSSVINGMHKYPHYRSIYGRSLRRIL